MGARVSHNSAQMRMADVGLHGCTSEPLWVHMGFETQAVSAWVIRLIIIILSKTCNNDIV